jgi:GDP-L-fucose synthase
MQALIFSSLFDQAKSEITIFFGSFLIKQKGREFIRTFTLMNKTAKIYIAGHRGMVGSAIVRGLQAKGYENLITATRSEVDLLNFDRVSEFIATHKPDLIIDAAARVGGILANNEHPYEFLLDNMRIQNNLMQAAHENDVDRFIFLGSSCIYPKLAPQPLKEDYLLTGPLEPTNQWYAIAKISGVKMCEAISQQFGRKYLSMMPTNLYGSNDNFDLKSSHVLPAMIRKFHEAKENGNTPVHLWGSGTPLREFLHVDDVADAVLFAFENDLPPALYNVGSGIDLSIKDLAELIQKTIGHTGEILWDVSKPDGTPRKLMDVSRLADLGWSYQIKLEDGIQRTYDWFLAHLNNFKEVKI